MGKFDLKSCLARLCEADGVSGSEENIAAVCADILKAYGKTEIDAFNNVLCTIGEFSCDKPTLLLSAHLDEIGMIVTYITDDGFLRVCACGGVDERVLPAAQVKVLGKERLCGVFTSVPPHLQTEHDKAAQLSDLYVDIGMSGERAKQLVSLGDRVLIENKLANMGELVTSKAIDDRSCIAAIVMALDFLRDSNSAFNIKILFSSKEETGSQGAKIAAFRENCDYALAVDVSFGKTHGESEENTGKIGSGGMIGISPTLSRCFSNALIATAKECGIDFQLEVMGGKTGTDADAFSVSGGGISACTLSVPIRYMHTPVESVSLTDIESTARLIAAFCERGL